MGRWLPLGGHKGGGATAGKQGVVPQCASAQACVHCCTHCCTTLSFPAVGPSPTPVVGLKLPNSSGVTCCTHPEDTTPWCMPHQRDHLLLQVCCAQCASGRT